MHGSAPLRDEHQLRRALGRTQQQRPRLGQVFVQPVQGPLAHRDVAILLAFSKPHQDHMTPTVNVAQFKAQHFLASQTAGVEQLQNGAGA